MWGFIHPNSPTGGGGNLGARNRGQQQLPLPLPQVAGGSATSSRRPRAVFALDSRDEDSDTRPSSQGSISFGSFSVASAANTSDFGADLRSPTGRRGGGGLQKSPSSPASLLAPDKDTGLSFGPAATKQSSAKVHFIQGGDPERGSPKQFSSTIGTQSPMGTWAKGDKKRKQWMQTVTQRALHDHMVLVNSERGQGELLEAYRKKEQDSREAKAAQVESAGRKSANDSRRLRQDSNVRKPKLTSVENKKRNHGQSTGVVTALDKDKKYQEELMKEWEVKNEREGKVNGDPIQLRQVSMLFDFLRVPTTKALANGSERYVREVLPRVQAVKDIEIGLVEKESLVGLPSPDFARMSMQMSPAMETLLRNALALCAQVSRPPSSSAMSKEDAFDRIRLFKPTFCRFLIDAQLVGFDALTQHQRPPYHFAARCFDAMLAHPSWASAVENEGGASAVGGGGSQAEQSASIDMCVSVINHLLYLTSEKMGESELWASFETGVSTAESLAQKRNEESRARALAVAKAAEKLNTDESCAIRVQECYSQHGIPPLNFQGSLCDWTRGLRVWAHEMNGFSAKQSVLDRCEQKDAQECFLHDSLTDPACIHVCLKYGGLFRRLFEAYCDEEKMQCQEDGSHEKWVLHMSYAAFFRFCLDFAIFPTLCSFNQIYDAYRTVDGAQELLHEATSRKFARAGTRLATLIGLKTVTDGAPRRNSGRDSMARRGSTGSIGSGIEECIRSKTHEPPTFQECIRSNTNPPSSKDGETEGNPVRSTASMAVASGSVLASMGNARVSAQQISGSLAVPPAGTEGVDVAQRGSVVPKRIMSKVTAQLPPTPPPLKVRAGERRLRRWHLMTAAVREDGLGDSSGGDSDSSSDDEVRRITSKIKIVEPAPVIKVPNDFSWVRRRFADMSPQQSKTYSLLSAIGDCAAGRFLGVRGLFAQADVADKQGVVDCPAALRALKRLGVKHDYEGWEELMVQFMKVVDQNACDKILDIAELEKAVEVVKEDQRRRSAHEKGLCVKGAAAYTYIHTLGDEARRLSGDPDPQPVEGSNSKGLKGARRLCSNSKQEAELAAQERRGSKEAPAVPSSIKLAVVAQPAEVGSAEDLAVTKTSPEAADLSQTKPVLTAFGVAAFAESVLKLGLAHMSESPSTLKSSAPTGVAALWLIAFLRFRFDQLLALHSKTKKSDARQGIQLPALLLAPLLPSDEAAWEAAWEQEKMGMAEANKPINLRAQDQLQMLGMRPQQTHEVSRAQGARSHSLTGGGAESHVGSILIPCRSCGERNFPDSKVCRSCGKNSERTASVERERMERGRSSPTGRGGVAPGAPRSPKAKNFLRRRDTTHSQPASVEDWRSGEVHETSAPEVPPRGSQYVSPLELLLEGSPELFEESLRESAEKDSPAKAIKLQSTEPCSSCGICRGDACVGNVFCHVCSGVDEFVASESLLGPVLERKRSRLREQQRKNPKTEEELLNEVTADEVVNLDPRLLTVQTGSRNSRRQSFAKAFGQGFSRATSKDGSQPSSPIRG